MSALATLLSFEGAKAPTFKQLAKNSIDLLTSNAEETEELVKEATNFTIDELMVKGSLENGS